MYKMYKEGIICRAKSIISSLCGIMLWASKFPIPMQIPNQLPTTYQIFQLGLKTLISAEGEASAPPCTLNHGPGILHSYKIPTSPSPPASSPSSFSSSLTQLSSQSSSAIDDLIGTDSGVCLSTDDTEIMGMEKPTESCSRHHSKRNQECAMKMEEEYPPPIPLLARTGNLLSHMPWVLTRHYVDGKLVLREEKVKNHEYFEAYRSNGRLILNLVSLNNTVKCCHPVYEIEDLGFVPKEDPDENAEEEAEAADLDKDDEDGEKDLQGGSMAIIAYSSSSLQNESERFGDFIKCFTYAERTVFDLNAQEHGSGHLSVAVI